MASPGVGFGGNESNTLRLLRFIIKATAHIAILVTGDPRVPGFLCPIQAIRKPSVVELYGAAGKRTALSTTNGYPHGRVYRFPSTEPLSLVRPGPLTGHDNY